jgi:hypothetical protein
MAQDIEMVRDIHSRGLQGVGNLADVSGALAE